MVNISRSESNWEARFSNITYAEACEIEKDKNVNEISIYQKLGVSDENFAKPTSGLDLVSTTKFDVRAYDENAFKNSNIYLTEGRFPENSNEILISLDADKNKGLTEKLETGDKLKVTLNGKLKEFTIVRQN